MGKDTRLVNIYIKIHNKRNLTIEDLNYLFKYDPECFEKTCRNVVYNVPDAKEVLQPKMGKGKDSQEHLEGQGKAEREMWQGKSGKGMWQGKAEGEIRQGGEPREKGKGAQTAQKGQEETEKKDLFAPEQADRERIEAALSNLKEMEQEGLPVGEIDVDTVKNLLGNLYMEMLFPHNGRAKFFNMEDQEYLSVFNKKV